MVEALCNLNIKCSRSKHASLYHTQSYKTTRNAIVYSHLLYFKVKRQSCGFYFLRAKRTLSKSVCTGCADPGGDGHMQQLVNVFTCSQRTIMQCPSPCCDTLALCYLFLSWPLTNGNSSCGKFCGPKAYPPNNNVWHNSSQIVYVELMCFWGEKILVQFC